MKNSIKIFLTIVFIIKSASYGYSQDLNKQQLQAMIDNMVVYKNYHVNIKKIVPEINGILVVVVGIPYREFPNIVILNKDTLAHKWVRIFEGLSAGLQNTQSGLLDWHTKNVAVDFVVDKLKPNDFDSEKMRALVESAIDIKGEIIIPYQNFVHMQTNTGLNTADFSAYTIDKTKYLTFGNILFGNAYKTYPGKQCAKYDTPLVVDCKLEQKDNVYTITAKTENNQQWVYTFKGVDGQNKYLVDKTISVSTIVH